MTTHSAPARRVRGTCFCGSVEIEVLGDPLEMGYCHCASCRAHGGAPFTSYLLWRSSDVRVSRGAELVGHFNKSGMSDRQFCMRCGGDLLTAHPTLDLTDVKAGILPTIPFVPQVHLHYAERVMAVRDGLRKLRDFPSEAGGSGEEVPE